MKQQWADVSIIIPTYNEEEELGLLIEEILRDLKDKMDFRILVVDDGSVDCTSIIARELGADVLGLQRTHGYGYALRQGLKTTSGSVVVLLDADGQIDPAEIPRLVDLILKGDADVVFAKKRKMTAVQRVGNLLLNFLTKIMLGVKITDFNTGFRAFRRSAFMEFDLKEDGPAINVELAAQAVKKKKKIVEVPTVYRKRFPTRAKTILSGFRILRFLVKESLSWQTMKASSSG